MLAYYAGQGQSMPHAVFLSILLNFGYGRKKPGFFFFHYEFIQLCVRKSTMIQLDGTEQAGHKVVCHQHGAAHSAH